MTGVAAIIQARTGSTRLPGKVLMDIAGEPMLARVMERAGRAKTLDEILVATTTESADDGIVSLCEEREWECFRGSEADVLDRYYQAAHAYHADHIVRITSDCPLIDPGVVDRVVSEFLERQPGVDYACNFLPRRTYPRGLDTEVMTFHALERSWREDGNPAHREHVTQYILRHPDLFQTHGVVHETDL
ncbi:MAG: glycosyltransferase family protein, partial [Methanomicrobiales archaeon]|nr:glycosyltransferase family protein [Methanomicrobiales archaeon]